MESKTSHSDNNIFRDQDDASIEMKNRQTDMKLIEKAEPKVIGPTKVAP